MKTRLKDPAAFYKPKVRPSGHDISEGFAKDNGGAIPANLLQIPNTESNGQYLMGCKTVGDTQHPARFPAKLPELFINMLYEPGDLVLDIFAGLNTTGHVAETTIAVGWRSNCHANTPRLPHSDSLTKTTQLRKCGRFLTV